MKQVTTYVGIDAHKKDLFVAVLMGNEAKLTAAAERAMQWLEDFQAKPFIGAESRLEIILLAARPHDPVAAAP